MKTIMVTHPKYRGTKVKVNGNIYEIHPETGYLIATDEDAEQLLLNTNKYTSVAKGDLIARAEHTRFEADRLATMAKNAAKAAKDAKDALDRANEQEGEAIMAAESAEEDAQKAKTKAFEAQEAKKARESEQEAADEPEADDSPEDAPETPDAQETAADEPEDAEIVGDGDPEADDEEPWPEVDENTHRDVMVNVLARLGVEHATKANKATLLDLIIEAYAKVEEE